MSRWQLQQAKQRFSELVERARTDGPQVVTRNGREVVVILDIEEYERLRGDFKRFLIEGPDFDALDLRRATDLPREVEL